MSKKTQSAHHKMRQLLTLPISTAAGATVLTASALFIGAAVVQAITPQSKLFPLQSVLGDDDQSSGQSGKDGEKKEEEHKEEDDQKEDAEKRAEEEKKAAEAQAEEARKAEERLEREQAEQKRRAEAVSQQQEQARESQQMIQDVEDDGDDDQDEDSDENEDDGDDSNQIRINTQTNNKDGAEVKFTFELKEGKMVLKTKTKEANSEIETESETELEQDEKGVNVQLAKQQLLIESDGDRLLFTHRNHVGSSHFPLRINGTTGELLVITPNGEKVVSVLPQQAVDNLLSKNFVIDTVKNNDSNNQSESTDSAEPVIADTLLELESEDGQLVYKVKAKHHQRLLGLMPVEIDKEVVVSAETGQLVSETTQGWLQQMLDIFAF